MICSQYGRRKQDKYYNQLKFTYPLLTSLPTVLFRSSPSIGQTHSNLLLA
ncbi:unnamed protein product [Penicillium roqueforti FM164]|uniref:Genomic scaffold, ProqFM164S02 n=1 Tax=Penicillium roqueforti (strain FM164) TaxID=1365484 RepID=W6QEE8_PENRF|nr:unnamed protein product [Penicillium roqueforti FM164]